MASNARTYLKEFSDRNGILEYVVQEHPHNGLTWFSFTCRFIESRTNTLYVGNSQVMKNKKSAQEEAAQQVVNQIQSRERLGGENASHPINRPVGTPHSRTHYSTVPGHPTSSYGASYNQTTMYQAHHAPGPAPIAPQPAQDLRYGRYARQQPAPPQPQAYGAHPPQGSAYASHPAAHQAPPYPQPYGMAGARAPPSSVPPGQPQPVRQPQQPIDPRLAQQASSRGGAPTNGRSSGYGKEETAFKTVSQAFKRNDYRLGVSYMNSLPEAMKIDKKAFLERVLKEVPKLLGIEKEEFESNVMKHASKPGALSASGDSAIDTLRKKSARAPLMEEVKKEPSASPKVKTEPSSGPGTGGMAAGAPSNRGEPAETHPPLRSSPPPPPPPPPPEEPEEEHEPLGSITEIEETRITPQPKRLKRPQTELKLSTTGALLVIDLDNNMGEDCLDRIKNHMARYPNQHGISRLILYTNPFQSDIEIPKCAEERKYKYRGDQASDDWIGITQISFDVGCLIPQLLQKTTLKGLIFFSSHRFGGDLLQMVTDGRDIRSKFCDSLKDFDKTLESIAMAARNPGLYPD